MFLAFFQTEVLVPLKVTSAAYSAQQQLLILFIIYLILYISTKNQQK